MLARKAEYKAMFHLPRLWACSRTLHSQMCFKVLNNPIHLPLPHLQQLTLSNPIRWSNLSNSDTPHLPLPHLQEECKWPLHLRSDQRSYRLESHIRRHKASRS